jgi:hypothetical protein
LQTMPRRPKTVSVVAAVLFVAAALAGVVGTSLLFPNKLLDRLWELNPQGAAVFRSWGRMAGVFLWAVGVATTAAAAGLLHRNKWAWWFAVVLFAIEGCGNVAAFFANGDLPRSASGVAISGAFLFALLRAPLRRYFDR